MWCPIPQIEECAVDTEIFETRLCDALLPLAKDPVPNIRLNVAKILTRMMKSYGTVPFILPHSFTAAILIRSFVFPDYYSTRPIYERIGPLILELVEDSDRDVRFQAAAARRGTGYVEPLTAEEEAAEAEATRQLEELEREEAEEMERFGREIESLSAIPTMYVRKNPAPDGRVGEEELRSMKEEEW